MWSGFRRRLRSWRWALARFASTCSSEIQWRRVACKLSFRRRETRSRFSTSLSICSLSLILLSTSCTSLPDEPLHEQVACRRPNREQWIGFYVLVGLAKQEKATGDEGHLAAAVQHYGGMLKRCGYFEEPSH